jgi:class 3 adenylate cyclase
MELVPEINDKDHINHLFLDEAERNNFIKNYEPESLASIYNFLPFASVINTSPLAYSFPNLSTSANERVEKLRAEIKEKETQNNALLTEVKRLKSENQDITTQNEEIHRNVSFIQKRERLLRLTSKIHPIAADIILIEDDSKLLNEFYSKEESQNVILSIDIRRSTDLMLNANSSDDFALFITGLCEGLKQIVITNFGVFDKFTGDGTLAYFPMFFSGEDAVQRCCKTAQSCHDFFSVYYKENRSKFKISLKTGLGIGIDYGAAKLVRVNDEPTIVGVPVVYACRLSSAPSGHTYLNQSAFQILKGRDIRINEVDVEIKNQGIVTIYDLIDLETTKMKDPDWYITNSEKHEP